MFELYIANKNYSSWSLRPWILMRELDIPFIEKLVPLSETDETNAFHSFSPTGKVPCLIDGKTVVWDSLAITEYLLSKPRRFGPPMPRHEPGRVVRLPKCIQGFRHCVSVAP